MAVDWQNLFLVLLGIACGVLGWLGNELWSAVSKLRADLNELEVHITRDFVSYARLGDAMRPVIEGIARIEHALIGKVDKP